MPDGFDIVQRGPGGMPPEGRPPGGGPPGGGPPMGRPPMGRPPMGRPPMGRPPMGRPPFRRRRRRPIFPIIPIFPPGRCLYFDRFGRCCDRFGVCCDRFGRCCDRFGRCNFGGPFFGFADTAETAYDGSWDRIDEDEMYGDTDIVAFNETDSDWDDQY